MPQRDRAAYMREYRKRRRDDEEDAFHEVPVLIARIRKLEAEVAWLKRELATRPVTHGFNTRPFRPVPKKGQ
jgi:hypothetical protein